MSLECVASWGAITTRVRQAIQENRLYFWGNVSLRVLGVVLIKTGPASWWLSGEESACQCRGPRLDPSVQEDPHFMEQRSPQRPRSL